METEIADESKFCYITQRNLSLLNLIYDTHHWSASTFSGKG